MEDLNAKIRELAAKENELALRKTEVRKKADKLLKAVTSEEENILDAARNEAAAEKERLMDESRQRSEEEVRQMLLESELEAKKRAVIFRGKSGDIIPSLFKDLEGYLNN